MGQSILHAFNPKAPKRMQIEAMKVPRGSPNLFPSLINLQVLLYFWALFGILQQPSLSQPTLTFHCANLCKTDSSGDT